MQPFGDGSGRGAGAAAAAPAPGPPPAEETAGYVAHGGEQLYYVHHAAAPPRRGQVLLAGPFTYERPHCYLPWVRWARFLAAHGYEALRFDYRGQGESTGAFEDFAFGAWLEDLRAGAAWLHQRQGAGVPLVLHGLGIGALLAARAFHAGVGSALLLWDPPASGRELLYDGMRLALARTLTMERQGPARSRDELIAQLEAGQSVEVDGYEWSPALWREGKQCVLGLSLEPRSGPAAPESAEAGAGPAGRPWRIAPLEGLAEYVFVGPSRRFVPNPWRRHGIQPLNPDLSAFFRNNLDWLHQLSAAAPEAAP